MEKSEMMKRFEEETHKQSAILKFMSGGQALEQKSYPKLGPYDYNTEYLAWLESKAAAYDRLMSGGKKTLKEWANIFGRPFAVERSGTGHVHSSIPVPNTDFGMWCGTRSEAIIDKIFIDFTGDWKDSLTLPDGWEDV